MPFSNIIPYNDYENKIIISSIPCVCSSCMVGK
nr:MAG TPA: hypothetical protein [Caudoviricetes sp.]